METGTKRLAGQLLPPLDHPYRSKTKIDRCQVCHIKTGRCPEAAVEQKDECLTGFP